MSTHADLKAFLRGRLSDLLPRRGTRSYSQEGEDILLERLLDARSSGPGFYVDVGAHHPTRFSNTHRFYRQGWRGINIDARPGSKRLFDRWRRRDINIECGIAATQGTLDFFVFNEPALNTFSAAEAARKSVAPYRVVRRIPVPVLPLSVVLDAHLPRGQSIDFLTIDVEGLDEQVVASNDWSRFRPRLVLVEMLGIPYGDVGHVSVGALLRTVGYAPVAKTCNTVLFAPA